MAIATALLLIVSSVVTSALMQMTTSQSTIWNRTEMHSGVRSATELLQQEVGQAGRITLPGPVTIPGGVVLAGAQTVNVSSAAGMFVGEQLTIDLGIDEEVVTLTAVNTATNQITATFLNTHLSNVPVPVAVRGAFSSGIVPTDMLNGSTGAVLKLYGDINSDGNNLYIEYTCDVVNGVLYRNVMAFDAPNKPAVGPAEVLLGNILPNPGGTPCFTYQQQTVVGNTYVTDVAITLTVQTQQKDAITKQYQTETKALLNVSPRNIFNVWQLASLNIPDHVQPMPPTVTALLP